MGTRLHGQHLVTVRIPVMKEGDLVNVIADNRIGVVVDTKSKPGFISVRFNGFDVEHWYLLSWVERVK